MGKTPMTLLIAALIFVWDLNITVESAATCHETQSNSVHLNQQRKGAVRRAMQTAWGAYKQHAWGKDELQPLSRSANEAWGGFAITMLDAMDTLWLMGMHTEFNEAVAWIEHGLDWNKDHDASVFETTIRALGGLLGAYSLSGEQSLLKKAADLGDILIAAYDNPSQLPSPMINLATRRLSWPGPIRLSEAGSGSLEMRALSSATNNSKYCAKADAAMSKIMAHPHRNDLYVDVLDATSGLPSYDPEAPGGGHVGIGAFSDSYYEYLLKLWLQSNKTDMKYREAWDKATTGFHKELIRVQDGKTFISGTATQGKMEHLSCFLPGALALGAATSADTQGARNARRDMETARALLDTCTEMYRSTATGLAAEVVTHSLAIIDSAYYLRPETVESLYWMYTITAEQQYQDRAWEIFQAIERNCRADKHNGAGYGAYPNVATPGPLIDRMESYFLAETLKYLYLIFDEDATKMEWHRDKLLTTEAHVIRVTGELDCQSTLQAKASSLQEPTVPAMPTATPDEYSNDGVPVGARIDTRPQVVTSYGIPQIT